MDVINMDKILLQLSCRLQGSVAWSNHLKKNLTFHLKMKEKILFVLGKTDTLGYIYKVTNVTFTIYSLQG